MKNKRGKNIAVEIRCEIHYVIGLDIEPFALRMCPNAFARQQQSGVE